MNKKNILILIVLYNKSLEESLTISSLSCLEKFKNKYNLNIIVYNNGPVEVSSKPVFPKGINFELINYLMNKPLSFLYNEIISNNKNNDMFIILDDDTSLSEDFFNNLILDADVIIPMIESNHNIYYPLINNQVLLNTGYIDRSFDVISIGSGLVISSKAVCLLTNDGSKLFNENFSLYGVDVSFFKKLNEFRRKSSELKVYCHCKINHSLSRSENTIAAWRSRERMIDYILSVLIYEDKYITKVIAVVKMACKKIGKLDFYSLFLIFYLLKNKTHPKCRQYLKVRSK
ncbi:MULTISPECIES: hypothetical protein [Klebsiella pneumoniae complex]|uniref:hypothetical protein n=1 Tax=Klebsiella pneumoniae complex TaxID=3390273 RepID=UPI0021A69C19|nr:hypothetical protein [Klebsiella variicola]UWS45717.1 hypothetical protein N1F85_08090 [Klebsiella variicola]HDH1530280.1 hypothetical protein [Klebsiella quasipneumoniae subsp. similipneumoniae]